MDEQRKIQRSRTLKGGTISFNRGGAIDCTIRNLSSTGACLEVATLTSFDGSTAERGTTIAAK
jgi:hypothetical protein